MNNLKERLEYHLDRAEKKEYDALTVETKVIRECYEIIFGSREETTGQFISGLREN